jgi:AraC-like DNA-binding protein
MQLLNVTNILCGSALILCIFFAILIFFSNVRNTSRKLFSIFLLSIAAVLFFFLLLDVNRQDIGLMLLPIFMLTVLSLGPLLWVYVKSVIGESSKKLMNSFIVPICFFLLIVVLFALNEIVEDEKTLKLISSCLKGTVILGLSAIFLGQNTFYIIKCFKLYQRHQLVISNSYSYTEKVNLNWLKILIFGYIFLISGLVAAHLVDDSVSYYFFYSTILLYVVFAGYHAITQKPIEIFEGIIEEISDKNKIDVQTEFFIQLKEDLVFLMEKKSLFLDLTLNIQELSNRLKTNNKYLSTLINQEFEMNFVSFVNSYRIEEAKKLLLDPDKENLTIEAIGNEAGFKSKSAFNVAFKKITGVTPSAFVKADLLKSK